MNHHLTKSAFVSLLLSLGLSALPGQAQAQLTGAGSSLVRELMGNWSTQYGPAAGGVTYEAVGSSAGVTRAAEQSVDFGVSDVPMTAGALRQLGLRQVPLAGAAVAVIVNLPELGGKSIKLNGDIEWRYVDGHLPRHHHAVEPLADCLG